MSHGLRSHPGKCDGVSPRLKHVSESARAFVHRHPPSRVRKPASASSTRKSEEQIAVASHVAVESKKRRILTIGVRESISRHAPLPASVSE